MKNSRKKCRKQIILHYFEPLRNNGDKCPQIRKTVWGLQRAQRKPSREGKRTFRYNTEDKIILKVSEKNTSHLKRIKIRFTSVMDQTYPLEFLCGNPIP